MDKPLTIISKLNLDHRGVKASKDDDPDLNLTYFTTRSKFVTAAYCTDTWPSCKVYETVDFNIIGNLVISSIHCLYI